MGQNDLSDSSCSISDFFFKVFVLKYKGSYVIEKLIKIYYF